MPAVLTEIGFLSNSKDRVILNNKAKQQEIAQALFDAFAQYKREYDSTVAVENAENGKSFTKEESQKHTEKEIGKREAVTEHKDGAWGIQIMSVAKRMNSSSSLFKGVPVTRYRVGNTYKYIHGSFATKEEALERLPKVRKKFPEAFVTKMQNLKPDR